MPLSSSPSAARGRRIVCSALAALGGASACFGSSSCIGGPSRGYALYAAEGRRPDPSEVARLSGYVRFVDGRDVSSYGASFELLPGCHVIGTRSTWGSDVSGSATGMIVSTGTWTFALPMRAGYAYSVRLEVPNITGPTSHIDIKAYETDARGATTRTFSHAESTGDIEQCRAEAGR